MKTILIQNTKASNCLMLLRSCLSLYSGLMSQSKSFLLQVVFAKYIVTMKIKVTILKNTLKRKWEILDRRSEINIA